jgi:hypothetical protein
MATIGLMRQKLIEREQFQDLFSRSLNNKNMVRAETKNSADIRMLPKKELNAIKLKLAGEAYQGDASVSRLY